MEKRKHALTEKYSDGVYRGSPLQYENKTHVAGKFQKCRRKEKMLKTFTEFFFYQGTKTKQLFEVLTKIYVRRYVIRVRVG